LDQDCADDPDYEIEDCPAQETAALVNTNWDEDENIKEASVEVSEEESEEDEAEPEVDES